MTTGWLLSDGKVLASVEIAETYLARTRGLLGRTSIEGALVIPRTRSVHTLFMRFPIDVAYCDADLHVIATVPMKKWRIGAPRRKARYAIEAAAGAFERWGLAEGDQLEIRPVS